MRRPGSLRRSQWPAARSGRRKGRRNSKPRPGIKRRPLLLAAGSVLGWVYILFGHPLPLGGRPDVTLPDFQIETAADGRVVARVDYGAWRSAWCRSGLPDPPDFNGSDPIPVSILLDTARRWVAKNDVNSIGRMGQIYQALEQNDAALACFAAVAEMNRSEPMWIYHLGVTCQRLGFTEPAIEQLEEVVRVDPEYATTYARLGVLYLDRGDYEASSRNYEAFRRRRPTSSLGYIGLGRLALARGETEIAVNWLRQAVRTVPGDYQAQHFLAQALATKGDRDASAKASEMAARLPRYSGWLIFDERLQDSHRIANTQRYLENELRSAQGRHDHATIVASCEELARRRPRDDTVLANLASIYRELGRLTEAEETIERAIALKPDRVRLHCIRAAIAFERRDFQAMDTTLDTAIELDPQFGRAYELRGRALFLQGRRDDAVLQMRKAVDLDPNDARRRLVLAEMLKQAGRIGEAIVELNALLGMDPGNAEARQLLAQLRPASSE